MKEKIFNTLLLLSVSLALTLSLIRGGSTAQAPMESVCTKSPAEQTQPLQAYRTRRANERKLETEALLSLTANEGMEKESRMAAGDRLMSLQQLTETELAVEALLTGRGYGEALCIADEKNLLIVLERKLTADEAAEILCLVEEISSYPAQNIRITC